MGKTTKFKLDGLTRPLVEIGEHRYRCIPATRSVEEKLEELSDEFDDIDSADELVANLGARYDLLCEPAGDAPDASAHVVELWEEERTTVPALLKLLGQLRTASLQT